ncbi:MAG: hypothetical protein HFH28_11390 [Clostridiaceae bacterium]|nr:hypothetical protein [Clostridiaceae bacterium]
MENFLEGLQQQRDCIESIASKIEQGEAYMEELKSCLPLLNQAIITLFDMAQDTVIPIEINSNYVLQVLNDILYGIEQEDPVYLADVLRYGLIEIFDYIGTELQREAPDE